MGEGRGSASSTSVVTMLLLCMCVFHSKMIYAATYNVGDAQGWSFGVQNWPSGKSFKAGDTLVFKYDPRVHNVVKVNQNGYNSCVASGGSPPYKSGNDSITLAKGANYFICGVPGHCDLGQKIAVNAN
ncbi:basic blue protein-like [Vicia villosa]|uniref:basic blue protein-like n=1 Tax=Vicia villosa TaxID=3911 RepID=UPI00273C7B99|nr:basic blue protein-like [Vicia villosa]XP_058763060.1 basic blue protein-like [Vicia villosa]